MLLFFYQHLVRLFCSLLSPHVQTESKRLHPCFSPLTEDSMTEAALGFLCVIQYLIATGMYNRMIP